MLRGSSDRRYSVVQRAREWGWMMLETVEGRTTPGPVRITGLYLKNSRKPLGKDFNQEGIASGRLTMASDCKRALMSVGRHWSP